MTLGLRLETKGMEAKARVKNYSMEIIGDGGELLAGYWTGKVKTKYRGSYFSIPVTAAYKLSQRVRINAGPYVSFMTSGDFNGHVHDGYSSWCRMESIQTSKCIRRFSLGIK